MVAIRRPRGRVPRSKSCNLPIEFAAEAVNMNLASGRFEPWHRPVLKHKLPDSTRSFTQFEGQWYGHASSQTRFFKTQLPKSLLRSNAQGRVQRLESSGDWKNLGYPVPEPPEVLVDPGYTPSYGPDTEQRTYRITYGTDCEEGPASCVSASVCVDPKTSVSLYLPPPPEDKWGVTEVNIYESRSLWDSSQGLTDFQGQVQEGYTPLLQEQQWFLVFRGYVCERQIILLPCQEPQNALLTDELLPPAMGACVAGETFKGSVVVFWENSIAFSERNKPWGFPLKTYHDFPESVENVAVCDNSVFVFTKGGIYLLDDDIDCKNSSERPVRELKEIPSPQYCTAVVNTSSGLLYASETGLVSIDRQGNYRTISTAAFDDDTWQQLGQVSQLILWRSRLFVSSYSDIVVWDYRFDDSGLLPPDVTSLTFEVNCWFVDHCDDLFFVVHGGVYQFDAADSYMTMCWRQGEQRDSVLNKISTLGVEYVDKEVQPGNRITVLKEGCESQSKQLKEGFVKIRSRLLPCYQLQVFGDSPMCALYYGQGYANIKGDS